MLDNEYKFPISTLAKYAFSRKKYFIFYVLFFLVISILISLNIEKRVVVNSTIVRTNDELLDPFLLKFRATEAFDEYHFDQILFKNLEGVINSQEKLHEVFLRVLDDKSFSIPADKKSSIASELSKSTKVFFDHYTNQYHLTMTVLQPIDEIEKLTKEFYVQLNQKAIEDFKKEISTVSKNEQRRLNIRLERIKAKDEIEWAVQKFQYAESYRVAQELGITGITSSKSEIYGAPNSLLGTKVLKMLVNNSNKTTYFSREYYVLKEAIHSLDSQRFSFEGLSVFSVAGDPQLELLNDKKAKALVVILGIIFGLVLGAVHVLLLFIREKK